MNDIKTSWKAFGLTIIYPWIIFFLILTAIFMVLQFFYDDPILNITFSVLMSLSAGVLGGFATKKWEDLNEEKLIINKGLSAIRNLWHILGGIILIERRVGVYLTRYEDEKESKKITKEVIRTYLEEIIEKCFNSEVEVLNSIEDWSDILPKYADVKPKIAEIQELNNKYNDLMKDVEQLDDQLEESNGKTDDQIEKLNREKRELLSKINRLENELNKKSSQLGTTFVTPSQSPSAIIGGTYLTTSPYPSALYNGTEYVFTSPSESGRVTGISWGNNQENEEEKESE